MTAQEKPRNPDEIECPYCGQYAPIGDVTLSLKVERMDDLANRLGPLIGETLYFACPNPRCQQVTVTFFLYKAKIGVYNMRTDVAGRYDKGSLVFHRRLIPASRAKQFPEYIPVQVIEDYNEACLIETTSPKASATLARRAVQGIIRDYYEIQKATLKQEIDELEGRMEPDVWAAVDALRQLGNIGAHPEKDINTIVQVEPGEAGALLELIELLLAETYVMRAQRKEQLTRVVAQAASKKKPETATS